MKKFFTGSKKKTESNATSIISVDSGSARKLQVSRSTEQQPRNSLLTDINNIDFNNSKALKHSHSQGAIKTTIMPTQPAMTKRLYRPTSSPPTLAMPRPRYAEHPTRTVLKTYEHEKTQLDPPSDQPSTPLSQAETETQNTPLPEYSKGDDDDKLYMASVARHSHHLRQGQKLPPTMPASTSINPRKVSPIVALPPQYDVNPIIRNKKSLDGLESHQSMDSIAGSDDSNRVYETALESPVVSTSTLMDHHHTTLATNGTTAAAAAAVTMSSTQSRRHSSPIITGFSIMHNNGAPRPPAATTTTSDSSVTVNQVGPPINSQPDHTIQPTTTKNSNNDHDRLNHTTRQQMQDPVYIKSLQQQVLFMQQQRTMDRVEYERMEQVHNERTQWMKTKINRTQAKLLELAAFEQQRYHDDDNDDDDLSPPPSFFQDQQYDDAWYHQRQQEFPDTPWLMSTDSSQSRQHHHHHQEKPPPSSTNSVISSSSSSSRLRQSKSRDSIPRLSRSSSKTSTSGRSSSGGHSYQAKQRRMQQQQQQHQQQQRHIQARMDNYSEPPPPMDEYPPPPPLSIDFMEKHPAHVNANGRRRLSGGSLSRQNSSGPHQQLEDQLFYLHQEQQDMYYSRNIRGSCQQQRPRPRAKSTDAKPPPPPPPPHAAEWDHYHQTDYYVTHPPSRPRLNDSRQHRRRQRNHSFDRQPDPPLFYDDDDDDIPCSQQQQQQLDIFEGEMKDDDNNLDGRYHALDGFSQRYYRQLLRYPPGLMAFIPPMSRYDSHRTRRPPPPPSLSSRMDMDDQHGLYGPQLPVSPYYPPPPSVWQQQQQHQIPPMDDTHYWQYSHGLTDMCPSPSFNRYPAPLQTSIAPTWMDDVPRPPPPSYWRGRLPSSSEYVM